MLLLTYSVGGCCGKEDALARRVPPSFFGLLLGVPGGAASAAAGRACGVVRMTLCVLKQEERIVLVGGRASKRGEKRKEKGGGQPRQMNVWGFCGAHSITHHKSHGSSGAQPPYCCGFLKKNLVFQPPKNW